jgi:hypothetical protein
LEDLSDISPKHIYEDTLVCIKYLSEKFLISDLDREHYLKIVDEYTASDDCVYFAFHHEDEVKAYIEKGYRQIDVDLANAVYRGNVEKVMELLKQGANPDFDPEHDGSTILDILGSEAV